MRRRRDARAGPLWALAAGLPCVSTAIVMRHDVPEQRFLELAARYPAAVSVRPEDRWYAEGTLIAPRWVLTAGPGDSGHAAFQEIEGKLYVIGVGSWQDTRPTNRVQGLYGVIEYYVRVSSYYDWIVRTMGEAVKD